MIYEIYKYISRLWMRTRLYFLSTPTYRRCPPYSRCEWFLCKANRNSNTWTSERPSWLFTKKLIMPPFPLWPYMQCAECWKMCHPKRTKFWVLNRYWWHHEEEGCWWTDWAVYTRVKPERLKLWQRIKKHWLKARIF